MVGGRRTIRSGYIPATHCGSVRTDGSFNAVLWENLTDPILTGRDELGIPKVYAEIPPLEVHGINAYVARAGWLGFEFARMEIQLQARIQSEPGTPVYPILGHKYLPRTGALGEADCEYAIVVPSEDPSRRGHPLLAGIRLGNLLRGGVARYAHPVPHSEQARCPSNHRDSIRLGWCQASARRICLIPILSP